MAKKNKVVDLKPKAKNISKEHLTELQEVVSTVNKLHFEIGKVESTKHSLLHRLAVTQDSITLLQDALEKEYGTSDVDISTGAINYPNNAE